VENCAKAVDRDIKRPIVSVTIGLSGVVFLSNPYSPDPAYAGLGRLVIGGYDLLVK
jgi:hypothetical protein